MKTLGKILTLCALIVFFSSQLVYAGSTLDKLTGMGRSLRNITKGAGLQRIDKRLGVKNAVGNFVGKYTDPALGGKVKSSSWWDVFTLSGFRKAVGITAGTAQGVVFGKEVGRKAAQRIGDLQGPDYAQGFMYNHPEKDNCLFKDRVGPGSLASYYYRNKDGTITRVPFDMDVGLPQEMLDRQ